MKEPMAGGRLPKNTEVAEFSARGRGHTAKGKLIRKLTGKEWLDMEHLEIMAKYLPRQRKAFRERRNGIIQNR